MAKVMVSMVLDRLPEHAEHPLQSLHVHLALQGLGRELHQSSQFSTLLPFVVNAACSVCVYECYAVSSARGEISKHIYDTPDLVHNTTRTGGDNNINTTELMGW